MKDRKKIDELFDGAFSSFEAEPPADTWNAIEQRLESRKRRRHIAYWRGAGTAAAVVLAFFTGYYFNPDVENTQQHFEQTEVPEEKRLQKERTYPQEENLAIDDNSNDLLTLPEKKSSAKAVRQKAAKNYTQNSETESLAHTVYSEAIQKKRESAPLRLSPKDGFAPEKKEQAPMNLNFPSDAVASITDDSTEEKILEDHSSLLTNNELKAKPDFETGGLSLGLMASPTFAFRDVNMQETNDALLAENVSNENLTNSYTAGLDVSYRQSSRLELQAGVYLNNWEQHNDRVILSTGSGSALASPPPQEVYGNTSVTNVRFENSSVSNDFTNFLPQDSSLAYAFLIPGIDQQYQFIDIPLSVGFYILESKNWGLKIRGGLTPRILANSTVLLAYADGTKVAVSDDGPSPFSLQLLAGTGVEYRINRHLRVQLLPSLQYGLTSVNPGKEVSTYFHQVLIYSGLSYKF